MRPPAGEDMRRGDGRGCGFLRGDISILIVEGRREAARLARRLVG